MFLGNQSCVGKVDVHCTVRVLAADSTMSVYEHMRLVIVGTRFGSSTISPSNSGDDENEVRDRH